MKTNEEREPEFFRWIRAAQAKIQRETKGMTPEEFGVYSRSRAEEAEKNRARFTPEEAEAIVRSALYSEEGMQAAPSRKFKAPAKTADSRRKVAKRLAHA